MRDEDDIWFDSLAGQTGDSRAGGAGADGASLRAAIRAHHGNELVNVDAVDPRREAALIERARVAGLLPTRARALTERTSRRPWPAWLAAAAIAAVVVGVSLQLRTPSPEPVVRGAVSPAVRIRAPDPLGLKRQLIQELGEAGVHATGYESFGRQGIDADLPTPVPDAVRSVLERHGIALPTDHVLHVEIEAAPPP